MSSHRTRSPGKAWRFGFNPLLGTVAFSGLFLSVIPNLARANVTIFDKDDWKISMGGFVETDATVDSTRSFREIIGNNPVSTGATLSGNAGRTEFSLRNSRLAFTFDAPTYEGWASKGYFEFDFLGYDAAPSTQSENSFYTSPTLRIRHAFMQTENDGWQILVGQYWNLFGWQPYYFPSLVDVSPISAEIYSRNPQFRALKAVKFSDQDVLQVAVAVTRPPQADGDYPGLEAGVRFAMGERSSGLTGSATGERVAQPMSIGVSGTAREFAVPLNATSTSSTEHYLGSAISADIMIPVIASSDGKDVNNTLSLLGEFSAGNGYGDLLNGWSGGTASPATLNTSTNLDAGIGAYDTNGNFQLIDLRTFNAHFQYHLPEVLAGTFIDGGYTQLYSNNIGSIANSSGTVSGGTAGAAYNREQDIFANIFHDFTPHIRAGFEYVHVRTDYIAGFSPSDNRYQLSGYFRF